MSNSSPNGRRSQVLTSPDRRFLSNFLDNDRNTEFHHRDALEAAQLEHDRVRQAAIRVYELHELQEEHRRILDAERVEQERLRAEAAIAAEERKLRELKARTIPKPPPEPEPPKQPEPPESEPPVKSQPQSKSAEPAKPEPTLTPSMLRQPPAPSLPAQPSQPKPPQQPAQPQDRPASQNSFAAAPSKPAEKPAMSSPLVNGAATIAATQKPQSATPLAVSPSQPRRSAPVQRYRQIHQELKKLRKNLQAESKIAGSPLKGKLGMFRREIRVSIGQLTGGKGANAQPIAKITSILSEARAGTVPSPPIDASLFVVKPRQPIDGDPNSGPALPSLFLYLLNICAKGIISQFINEGGANTKAADPVGVFAAHIFSHNNFQWRGASLIDILLAKYCVVCPVLFGLRGNDKTERGRLNLGWRKEGPAWITEQSHNDRMTGLGAGFASISLRDFSKSSKVNPYPPTNYWMALASIVNTPAGETSNTQYVVLRAMIESHEKRFLQFYGNAALAALCLALVEFPKKAPANASAAGSLRALADLLREDGLALA